jgi:hypothetical protein
MKIFYYSSLFFNLPGYRWVIQPLYNPLRIQQLNTGFDFIEKLQPNFSEIRTGDPLIWLHG